MRGQLDPEHNFSVGIETGFRHRYDEYKLRIIRVIAEWKEPPRQAYINEHFREIDQEDMRQELREYLGVNDALALSGDKEG